MFWSFPFFTITPVEFSGNNKSSEDLLPSQKTIIAELLLVLESPDVGVRTEAFEKLRLIPAVERFRARDTLLAHAANETDSKLRLRMLGTLLVWRPRLLRDTLSRLSAASDSTLAADARTALRLLGPPTRPAPDAKPASEELNNGVAR